MCQALLEIMESEINKIKNEVREEAKHNVIICTVKSLRELGADNAKIIELLIKNHGLSTQEAEKYL